MMTNFPPGFFPPQCPPLGTHVATGTFYRLVKNESPTADDFKSPYEENPGRDFEAEGTTLCDACGVSMFADMADSVQLRKRVKGFRKRMIARGVLENLQIGSLQHTPRDGNSHHDWWLPEGAQVHQLFSVVQGA